MATPTLVQHASTPKSGYNYSGSTFDKAGSVFSFYPPNDTLSGNLLIVGFQALTSGGLPTWTVTDNLSSGGWAQALVSNDTTNHQGLWIWYLPNAGAGINKLTITPSSPAEFASFKFSEFYNVLGSSPLDGTSSNFNTGTAVTAGSITTVSDGDLIWAWMIVDDLASPPPTTSVLTKGSGFTLLDADASFATGSQYQVQSSHGAINAGFTLGTSHAWNCGAVAFKAASAGTTPNMVPRVVRRIIMWMNGSTTVTVQTPCQGNVAVVLWDGSSGNTSTNALTAISDSNSNTWTSRGAISDGSAGVGTCQVLDTDAAATTPSTDMTLTFTSNVNMHDCVLQFFDMQMAFTSGNYDTIATATNEQTSTADLTTVSITPTTTNGVVVHHMQIDYGSMLTLSSAPTHTHLDVTTFPENDGSFLDSMDSNNGHAHVYNANTNQITFIWNYNPQPGHSGVGFWSAIAASYKGSPVAGDSLPYPSFQASPTKQVSLGGV